MSENRVIMVVTASLWVSIVIAVCTLFAITRNIKDINVEQSSSESFVSAAAEDNSNGAITSESDGVYCNDPEGSKLTGWQRIDGQKYYFDPANGGKAATGWTWIDGLKYYFDKDGHLVQNVDSIIGHKDSYYVTVNCATQTVMVYAQDEPGGEYNGPVRAMVCSTGGPGNETIQGTFPITKGDRWGTLFNDSDYVYGQYVSVISGNYLFHSCWYYRNGDSDSLSVSAYNKLGTACSHGCVRMSVADCKWVWENCAGNNSTVRIYTADEPAPFDRPEVIPAVAISGDMGRDPTDDSTAEDWTPVTQPTETRATEARVPETRSTETRATEARASETRTTPTQTTEPCTTRGNGIDPVTGEHYETFPIEEWPQDPRITEPLVTDTWVTDGWLNDTGGFPADY